MTTSPDYTPYVDLTLHDKSPADILAAGMATLQARIPDWVPTASNIEVLLLEAMAIEVGETLFALNRIPRTLLLALFTMYGVTPDPGERPYVDVTFTAQDDSGYVVPAGTEVALLINEADYSVDNEYLTLHTNTDLVIASPTTSGTVIATADVYTDTANGIPSGSTVEIVDSVTGIDSAVTGSAVGGGRLPETEESLVQRGAQRLSRLSDTLQTPNHFTQAALETTGVVRATTIDNWDSTGPDDPGENPGYVAVVVYGNGAPLSAGAKTSLQGELELRAAANLIITVIDPTVQDVAVTASVAVLPGYTGANVISAVETRLNQYLSPSSWPWSGTVRRNELISVIDQVEGVDYVDSLTVPANDVVISAANALARASTLTITTV